MTMIGITRITWPVVPPTVSSGMKAAMVVSAAKTTGRWTPTAPSTAASRPLLPASYSL